jgi:hypothetical protein
MSTVVGLCYVLYQLLVAVSAVPFVSARFGSEKKKSKPRPSDTAVAGTNSARCSPLPPPLVGLAGPSVPTSPTTDCSSASPRPQAASPIFDFNTKLWRKVCYVFSVFLIGACLSRHTRIWRSMRGPSPHHLLEGTNIYMIFLTSIISKSISLVPLSKPYPAKR